MTDLLIYLGLILIVIGESTIIIGTFVPGFNSIMAAAFLASAGELNVFLVFGAAWLGMFIGDYGGYILGRYGIDKIPAAEKWFLKAKPQVERFLKDHRRLLIFYQFIGFARAPLPIFLGSIKHPAKDWTFILLRSTTVFMVIMVGGSYLLGTLVGEDLAIKLAIALQVVVTVVFAVYIAQALIRRRKKRRKA